MINFHDTLTMFSRSVHELLSNRAFRYANPGEQAVTAELSQLMRAPFQEWNVSAEWDRREDERKMLAYGWGDEVEKLRAIRPDIIVHHIGLKSNLLVIEAKRVENRNDAQDKAKLAAMTRDDGAYSYMLGIRIVLDLQNGTVSDCEVFSKGESNLELTEFLREQLQVPHR